MNKQPFVSICVSSYNRSDIIDECLRSLINLDYPKDCYEIIIIDNNSSDNTCEIVKKTINNDKFKYKNFKLIESKKNLGSAGTLIEVLNYLDLEWEYILKMDEDVILDSNCLKELIKMSSNVAVKGIIGGKILYHKEKNLIQAIGSRLHPFYAIAKGIGINQENNSNNYNLPCSIDAPNGCMILIPKYIYENVTWFYKEYFIYYDDHEIMYQVKKKGLLNYYCPTAIAYHDTFTGNKAKYSNHRWLYYSVRNSLLFMQRNCKTNYTDFILYFLGHNFKFLLGIMLVFYFSKFKNLYQNLYTYFLGYYDGILGKGGYKKL